MVATAISPALPVMRAHFSDVPQADLLVRLVLTITALFIVIGAPIAGLLVDRWGRKSLLVAAAVFYGLAGSAGFVLETLSGLLLVRALLGLATAGTMTSGTTLIADYYSGPARARLMGWQSAVMSIAGMVFLSLGGVLADLSWQAPFLIYLSTFILLPFIILVLYEPRPAATLSPDGTTEARGADPDSTSPVRLSIKSLALVYTLMLLLMGVYFFILVQLPFYLTNLTQASATDSGLAIAVSTLFSAAASLLYGRVKQRLSFVGITALALGLMGGGFVIIGLSSVYGQVVIGLSLNGLGFGLLFPNLTVWVSAISPVVLRGRALGGLTTFLFLGQFLSPFVSQPMSQQLGFGPTYSLTGGFLLLLAVIFVGSRQRLTAPAVSPARQA